MTIDHGIRIAQATVGPARVAPQREFQFKTTDQLSAQEQEQFLLLFARTFPRVMGSEEFCRKYLCTPHRHSYHGLMHVNGVLVGAYNLIPYVYNCFGARRLFGLSADTMIAEEHRGGPFNLMKMASLACDGARREGVSLVFGFPNENAYSFTCRVLKWSDMGELDFYALPLRIGAIKPALRWANPVSRLVAAALVRLPSVKRAIARRFDIEKVNDESFQRHRYDRAHERLDLGAGAECRYRTCLEAGGVRTTYLIDVTPLAAGHFARAVRAVHARVARTSDLLLYVGRPAFRPPGLFRVPPGRRPRRIRMCGRILDWGALEEDALNVESWNVNLSNFDVR